MARSCTVIWSAGDAAVPNETLALILGVESKLGHDQTVHLTCPEKQSRNNNWDDFDYITVWP